KSGPPRPGASIPSQPQSAPAQRPQRAAPAPQPPVVQPEYDEPAAEPEPAEGPVTAAAKMDLKTALEKLRRSGSGKSEDGGPPQRPVARPVAAAPAPAPAAPPAPAPRREAPPAPRPAAPQSASRGPVSQPIP